MRYYHCMNGGKRFSCFRFAFFFRRVKLLARKENGGDEHEKHKSRGAAQSTKMRGSILKDSSSTLIAHSMTLMIDDIISWQPSSFRSTKPLR